jgi:quercetin dioxygenase-like cupin family protein
MRAARLLVDGFAAEYVKIEKDIAIAKAQDGGQSPNLISSTRQIRRTWKEMDVGGSKQQADVVLATPAEIQWAAAQAVLPAGAQVAVLYGDPTKEGLFSMRFKLPKGYRVPPHTLSKAGTFTVISGTFRIGMGDKADASKARAMPTGSFIALPPGAPHFVSVDEETVVQLNNIGPWELTYSDPQDDPRQQPR